MITLYSYPELFGVADNNGYGLKVFAFFKLTGVSFTHQHIFDASAAPRGQLLSHLVTRMLDDLYWVMSYSRWKDERFWPEFCDALRREHPILTEEALRKAKEFNSQRYYYQGIGRYAPSAAYARGLADLQVLANLIPADGYLHGPKPTSIDAAIYGFIANIFFLRDRHPT
jgi:Glutathione S-transferase, C-terminal domain